jgi:5-methylthioadenosine/S-adenosylhomocysteine deaminase
VDLKVLNLSPVLEGPVRTIVPNLVYVASGHEVRTVMVAGRVLVRDGVVLAADEGAIRAEAQVQAEAVARRVAADPVHTEMALLQAMEAGQL